MLCELPRSSCSLPTSQCEADPKIQLACYSPLQLRAAYDTAPLYAAGITGKGRAELYLDGALQPFLGARTGIVDVTSGNNSFEGVTGYPAKPGYDLATGWGTVDVAKFVHALAPGSRF